MGVRHVRGDHDAAAVVERDEPRSEGAVVQRVEQEAVRRHEALVLGVAADHGLMWLAEQGGNVDAREDSRCRRS